MCRAFILLKPGKEQTFEMAARHEAPGVPKHDNVSPAALALVEKDNNVLLVENAVVDVRNSWRTLRFTDCVSFNSLGSATMSTSKKSVCDRCCVSQF